MFEPGAVSPLVTWQDGRCSSGFLASLPQPESHLSVASGFGCATIFWFLKNRYGQLIFESGAGFPGTREQLGVYLQPVGIVPPAGASLSEVAWHRGGHKT